jgi:hypothetical protein
MKMFGPWGDLGSSKEARVTEKLAPFSPALSRGRRAGDEGAGDEGAGDEGAGDEGAERELNTANYGIFVGA